jgi:hypothetical protein
LVHSERTVGGNSSANTDLVIGGRTLCGNLWDGTFMVNEEKEQTLPPDDVDVVDPSGKKLYFSLKKFIGDIAEGNRCFICGADPNAVVFNNEHVIPDWILAQYSLHSRTITIPNRAQQMYGGYTIPCCEECNQRLASTFETPISAIVKGGHDAIREYISSIDGPRLFFQWLALIYLKTHLKDKQLRLHLDRRRGSVTVSNLYEWKELHHIHCVARAFYTGATIEDSVFGSFVLWRAKCVPQREQFDYRDSYLGRTILLRLGDAAFIAVLNDSGGVKIAMEDFLQRLPISMSPLQLRELMTRMAHMNMRVAERPVYGSEFSGSFLAPSMQTKNTVFVGSYTISAELPERVSLLDVPDRNALGEMLAFNLRDLIGEIAPPDGQESLIETMRDGLHSFIFRSEEGLLEPLVENDLPKTQVDLKSEQSSESSSKVLNPVIASLPSEPA